MNENEQELDRFGLVYIELVFGDFDALHGNGEKRKKNGAWVHATTCPLLFGFGGAYKERIPSQPNFVFFTMHALHFSSITK